MRALLRLDRPQREQDARIPRRQPSRSFEKTFLCGRRWRDQPLDVVFERVEGRIGGCGRRTRVRPSRRRPRDAQLRRNAIKHGKQIGQRTLIRHVGHLFAFVEANQTRTNFQRVVDSRVADDDLGCADKFANTNHRRA